MPSRRKDGRMGDFLAKNNIKAVLLDIDGTLYPKRLMNLYLVKSFFTAPFLSLSYNKMRQTVRQTDGIEAKPVLTLSDFRRKEADIIFRGKSDIDYEAWTRIYEKKLEARWDKASFSTLKPFPGMKRTLEKVHEKGLLLGALSDFPLGRKLEKLGVRELFDYARCSEEYGYLKPSSVPFAAMLEELKLNPGEALYIGDSYSKDVLGAGNAGLRTMLITSKSGPYPEAGLVAKSWDEVYNELF
jgi:haloacid dehalogenase superfamily, subfamily IA, variant 1 with third motif having Dx(3-4)D or Dx(3-4)E